MPNRNENRKAGFVEGKLNIKFKPGALRGAAAAMAGGAARRVRRPMRGGLPPLVAEPMAMLAREAGIRRITPIAPAPAPTPTRAPRSRGTAESLGASYANASRASLRGLCVVELRHKDVSEATLRRIAQSDAVEFVERVPRRWFAAARAKPDPSRNLQWGLRAIEWFEVKKLPDAADVHVAVIDTGVDERHPDLEGAIAGYDRASYSRRDYPGHGTHVAGIIGARINNGIGISGIANCKLLVWKVFGDPTKTKDVEYDDDAYNTALAAVLDSKARVVNLSVGGYEPSDTEQLLIKQLVAEGCVVVAAMGNEYDDEDNPNPTEWPAAYPDVVAVGAIGQTRRRAAFSNTGRHIDLCAPGEGILSTLPSYTYFERKETDYAAWPGTSMAAPHVAGVAALLKARYPDRDGAWIRRRLAQKAIKLAAMRGAKFSAAYGHGLVSVRRAL